MWIFDRSAYGSTLVTVGGTVSGTSLRGRHSDAISQSGASWLSIFVDAYCELEWVERAS